MSPVQTPELDLPRRITNLEQRIDLLERPTPRRLRISTSPSASAAGYVDGLDARVGDLWPNIVPGAGDFVTTYSSISSSAARNRIWAINTVTDVVAGADAMAWGIEIDLNNNGADVPNLFGNKVGLDLVGGDVAYANTTAIRVHTARAGGNGWRYGLHLTGIISIGLLIDNFAVSATPAPPGARKWPGIGISVGVPSDASNVPSTALPGTILARQFADGGHVYTAQRFTDTAPSGRLFRALDLTGAELAYVDVSGEIRSAVGLGTKHEAAATPTGGLSGDIRIGNGQIWAKDGATWKSVAIV